MGGSATTASILKMAVVFLTTNPSVLDCLVRELDDAAETGRLSSNPQYKVHLIKV